MVMHKQGHCPAILDSYLTRAVIRSGLVRAYFVGPDEALAMACRQAWIVKEVSILKSQPYSYQYI